jgi:uncharacterized protein with HEPN domain
MQRDNAYLLDILEAAKLVLEYIGDKDREYFLKDTQCQDAVIRRFAVIGEASRRISDEMKAAYPDVAWHEMIGMRNAIIHEYDDIDMFIVWDTAKKDIPALISTIEKLLRY